MPNIASVFKSEIARVARKEIRAEVESLKKASAQQRSAIAELRRRVEALTRELRRTHRAASRAQAATGTDADESDRPQRRFSAARLASHRAKLGLSREAYGRLVGVSGQSIYAWERGTTRPRAAQIEALAVVRGIRKQEAARRLEQG